MAHTLKNSRARKERCPQAKDFTAVFLPLNLALGNRGRVGGRVGGTGRLTYICTIDGLPYMGSAGKESAYNAGYLGSIPGLGRSPGEGNGNPLHYSCLENSMDRGAWWATAHGGLKESDATEQLPLSISL